MSHENKLPDYWINPAVDFILKGNSFAGAKSILSVTWLIINFSFYLQTSSFFGLGRMGTLICSQLIFLLDPEVDWLFFLPGPVVL
jgi:hypothetical protein